MKMYIIGDHHVKQNNQESHTNTTFFLSYDQFIAKGKKGYEHYKWGTTGATVKGAKS
jgi:hypothetical protein